MVHDFSKKVVLITGGTGALGRSMAEDFVVSNAITVITYRKRKGSGKRQGQTQKYKNNTSRHS